jgi:hypothetical protein
MPAMKSRHVALRRHIAGQCLRRTDRVPISGRT